MTEGIVGILIGISVTCLVLYLSRKLIARANDEIDKFD